MASSSNGCEMPSESSVEATLFREKLYQEEPKMDAAIKSYCSWLLAHQHGTTYQKQEVHQLGEEHDAVLVPTSHSWEMTEVLGLARKLSKSINSYVFDIRLDESTERSIVAQVWNELAAMSTNNNSSNSSKPSSAGVRITKMLGQTALIFAWKDLDRSDLLPLPTSNKVEAAQVDEQQEGQPEQLEAARLFLETFERFLFANTTFEATASAVGGAETSGCSSSTFNDAQLIWSPDGGKTELSRRASQRQKVALERRQQEEESQRGLGLLQLQHGMSGSAAASTPTITIIEEGEGKES